MSKWKTASIALAAIVLAVLLLNLAVIRFTIHIWTTNETYTHGFLIVPISAWLIWRKRHVLAAMTPSPAIAGIVPFFLCSIIWQLGHQAGAMVVEQYAMIGMIVSSALTVLGTRIFKVLAFPLFFLVLAVPVGESLIPPLMNFTADFTVDALHLTGIPVYKEGTFFSLPDANWSVIDACSGLRYLISSLTLGILYAYLTYRSLSRKLAFVAISAVVPIFANGIRAYMIVMIGHLGGMRFARGIDHLIYGWIFFGFVMLLLFWIGSFFREEESDAPDEGMPEFGKAQASSVSVFPVSLIMLVFVVSNAAYATYLDRKLQAPVPIHLDMSELSGWQERPGTVFGWIPHYPGSRATFARTYTKNDESLSLYVAYYRNQRQGKELITSGNLLVDIQDPVWGNIGEKALELRAENLRIRQALLRSPNDRLVAWEWYWVDGRWTRNPYMAKFFEAESRIMKGSDAAAVVVVFSPYEIYPDRAAAVLKNFVGQSLPAIAAMLEKAEK